MRTNKISKLFFNLIVIFSISMSTQSICAQTSTELITEAVKKAVNGDISVLEKIEPKNDQEQLSAIDLLFGSLLKNRVENISKSSNPDSYFDFLKNLANHSFVYKLLYDLNFDPAPSEQNLQRVHHTASQIIRLRLIVNSEIAVESYQRYLRAFLQDRRGGQELFQISKLISLSFQVLPTKKLNQLAEITLDALKYQHGPSERDVFNTLADHLRKSTNPGSNPQPEIDENLIKTLHQRSISELVEILGLYQQEQFRDSLPVSLSVPFAEHYMVLAKLKRINKTAEVLMSYKYAYLFPFVIDYEDKEEHRVEIRIRPSSAFELLMLRAKWEIEDRKFNRLALADYLRNLFKNIESSIPIKDITLNDFENLFSLIKNSALESTNIHDRYNRLLAEWVKHRSAVFLTQLDGVNPKPENFKGCINSFRDILAKSNSISF